MDTVDIVLPGYKDHVIEFNMCTLQLGRDADFGGEDIGVIGQYVT